MTRTMWRCLRKTSTRYARTCRLSAIGSVVSGRGTRSSRVSTGSTTGAHLLLAGDEGTVGRDLVEHLAVPADGNHRTVHHERHAVGDVEHQRAAGRHERRPAGARRGETTGDARL